jgi:hypothetical protein
MKELERKGPGSDLPTIVAACLAGWPTPDKSSGDGGRISADPLNRVRRSGAKKQLTINEAAQLAGWGTPTAQDAKHATVSPSEQGRDPAILRIQVFGAMSAGSPVPMAKRGQLNPAHSRWLQGYPPAWDDCAVMAMPSSRKSPKRSSKPTVTPEDSNV